MKGCSYPTWHADGECDDINNKVSCFFDGGDCCGPDVSTLYCTECLCHKDSVECSVPAELIGNGFCNDEANNGDCTFDGGDCCGPDISCEYIT